MSYSFTQFYRTFDILKLTETHGATKALVMYGLGSVGCLLLMSSIIILAVNSDEISSSQNVDVLNIANRWTYSNKKQATYDSKYQMSITDSHGRPIESEHILELQVQGENSAGLGRALGLINEDSKGNIIVPTAFHQASVDFMQTKHIKLNDNLKMCLSLETQLKNKWYPVQGLDNCNNGQTDGISIQRSREASLSIDQMQIQGICQKEECHRQCLAAGGQFVQGECKAKYFVHEACFVVQNNQRTSHILQGCYNGAFERLSFHDDKQIMVTIRDPADPYLKIINLFKDGSHNTTLPQSQKVLLARKIFTIGAALFFLCAILTVYFQQHVKPQEIELQELSSSRRSIAVNY